MAAPVSRGRFRKSELWRRTHWQRANSSRWWRRRKGRWRAQGRVQRAARQETGHVSWPWMHA